MNTVIAEVFEVEPNNIEEIIDNFGLKTFSFRSLPHKGEQVVLHTGHIGPIKLYHVEMVRHHGRTDDAARAFDARTVIYVSELRTMIEYL